MAQTSTVRSQPTRVSPTHMHKTQMCKFHILGECVYGVRCAFAHHASDLRPRQNFRQTSLCQALIRTGWCKDPYCTFAHNKEELRPRSDTRRLPDRFHNEIASVGPLAARWPSAACPRDISSSSMRLSLGGQIFEPSFTDESSECGFQFFGCGSTSISSTGSMMTHSSDADKSMSKGTSFSEPPALRSIETQYRDQPNVGNLFFSSKSITELAFAQASCSATASLSSKHVLEALLRNSQPTFYED